MAYVVHQMHLLGHDIAGMLESQNIIAWWVAAD
jgi:hypothetical protein